MVALAGDTRPGGQTRPLPRVVSDVMSVLTPGALGEDRMTSDTYAWDVLLHTMIQHTGPNLARQYVTEWGDLLPIGAQALPMQDVFVYARAAGLYQNSILSLLPKGSRGLQPSTLQANLPYIAATIDTPAYPEALRRLVRQHSTVIDTWCSGTTAANSDGPESVLGHRPRVALLDPRMFFLSLLLLGMDASYTLQDGFGPPPIEFGPDVDPEQQQTIKDEILGEMQEMLDAVGKLPVLRRSVLSARPENENYRSEFQARLSTFSPAVEPVLDSPQGLRVMTDFLCAARDYAVATQAYTIVNRNLNEQWALVQSWGQPADAALVEPLAGCSFQELAELFSQAAFCQRKPHTSTGYTKDAPLLVMLNLLAVSTRLNGLVQLHGCKVGREGEGKGEGDLIVGLLQVLRQRGFTPQGMNDLLLFQPGAVTSIPEIPESIMVSVEDPSMGSSALRHSITGALEGSKTTQVRSKTFDSTAEGGDDPEDAAPAPNVLFLSKNYGGKIFDRAVWSRVFTQVMGSDRRATQWGRVLGVARQHNERIRTLFHVGQAVIQLVGGMFDHRLLPMTSGADMWVDALMSEAVAVWTQRTLARAHHELDNRTRSNMIMAAHQLAWTTCVHQGLHMALAAGVFDLATTSADAVAYTLAVYAQEYHQQLQTAAVFSILDGYLETLVGASILDRILCAGRIPGHSLSFVNAKHDAIRPTIEVDEASLRAEMASERWLRAIGPMIDTAWPLPLCHAIRTIGVSRSAATAKESKFDVAADLDDMDDEDDSPSNFSQAKPRRSTAHKQRVLSLRPCAIAHSYPTTDRAILCTLLHLAPTIDLEQPAQNLDHLAANHMDALQALQARSQAVVEYNPVRLMVTADPYQRVHRYLTSIGIELDTLQNMLIVLQHDDQVGLDEASQVFDDETFDYVYGYELSPWRVTSLLHDSAFLAANAIIPENVPKLWEHVMQVAAPVPLDELLSRTPGLNQAWLVQALANLGVDPDSVIRCLDAASGAYALELPWALMTALRVAIEKKDRRRTRDLPALQQLCTFGLGTMPMHVFPVDPALRSVLDAMVAADTPRPEWLTVLPVRALGSHRLNVARIRTEALDAAAMALLSNAAPLSVSFNEIRAECQSRYEVAVTDQDIQSCFAAVRLITLPAMGTGVDPQALTTVSGRAIAVIKPVVMPMLYASLSGSVIGMLASAADKFDHLASDAIAIVTVQTRDPLDWSRPASYAVAPRGQRLMDLVADPQRMCRETAMARVLAGHQNWHAGMDDGPIALLRRARDRFRPVEVQLAQRAANGSDGNFGYVRVERPDTWADFYDANMGAISDRELVSVQKRVRDEASQVVPSTPAKTQRFAQITPATVPQLELDLTVSMDEDSTSSAEEDDEELATAHFLNCM